MPVLIYEGPELNPDQREEIVKGLTEVASKIMPEVPKQAFYVFLREHPEEKLGVGGLMLKDYLAQLQQE